MAIRAPDGANKKEAWLTFSMSLFCCKEAPTEDCASTPVQGVKLLCILALGAEAAFFKGALFSFSCGC